MGVFVDNRITMSHQGDAAMKKQSYVSEGISNRTREIIVLFVKILFEKSSGIMCMILVSHVKER